MDEQKQPTVRPKGQISTQSVRKLKSLGYDPIEKLIELQNQVDEMVTQELAKARPSSIALSNFLNTKRFIATELVRYKYGRVPEPKPDENTGDKTVEPFTIILEG
jgi:hypothetical protein